jgi:hypothetical protein
MSEKEKTKIKPRVFYTSAESDKCIVKKREDEQPPKAEDVPAYEAEFVTFGTD